MYKILKWKLHCIKKNIVGGCIIWGDEGGTQREGRTREGAVRGLGVMIKVIPELIRSGLQTYPRYFKEEQDDYLKPGDKTKTKKKL